MKYYQIPTTQVVRLSSGEVMGLSINTSGGNQGDAMAPRRIYL